VKIDEKAVMVKRCIDDDGIKRCFVYDDIKEIYCCPFFDGEYYVCQYIENIKKTNKIEYIIDRKALDNCPLWKDDNGNS